ncbi:hypothetical protein PABG_11731 [Paracoccidioides brasiliensis Pb03]|nr:hypothetical protein PABG_11731 [Paracoccidioides brasiliensis Pb03]
MLCLLLSSLYVAIETPSSSAEPFNSWESGQNTFCCRWKHNGNGVCTDDIYDTADSDSEQWVLRRQPLDFARRNADAIMKASPIPLTNYIRDARLSGALFKTEDPTGLLVGFSEDHSHRKL